MTTPAPQVWPTLRATDAPALIDFLVTAFARAVAAGATVVQAPADTGHGRECQLRDPEGNRWSFGTYPGAPRS